MTDPVPLTFGEELRRERTVRDISLEEISAATKISVRLLTALESSNLSRLPAPIFTRGFIRAYALHLGIDPDEKVNAYLSDLKLGESGEAPAAKKARPRSRFLRGRRTTAGTIVGGVAGILLLVGWIASPERRPAPPRAKSVASVETVAFKNVSFSSDPTPAIRQDPSEMETATAAVPSPVAVGVKLTLECEEDSWAKLMADGATVFSGMIRRGESYGFQARQGFRLTLGNAGGVRVTVDGRPLDPLGGDGEVVRDLPIPTAERG